MPEQSPFNQYRAEIHYFDQNNNLVHVTKMPSPWDEGTYVAEQPRVEQNPQDVDIQALINPEPALPKKPAPPNGSTTPDVAMATKAQVDQMYRLAVQKRGIAVAQAGLVKMKDKPVTYQAAIQIIHDLTQLPDFVDPELSKQ